MAIVLIGTHEGILTHAGATLDELAIVWVWGSSETRGQAGDVVILEEPGGGASIGEQNENCVVLRVPADDEAELASGKIDRLAASTEAGGGTLAIGKAGAINAALFAARILAVGDVGVRQRLDAWVNAKRDAVLATPDPSVEG